MSDFGLSLDDDLDLATSGFSTGTLPGGDFLAAGFAGANRAKGDLGDRTAGAGGTGGGDLAAPDLVTGDLGPESSGTGSALGLRRVLRPGVAWLLLRLFLSTLLDRLFALLLFSLPGLEPAP